VASPRTSVQVPPGEAREPREGLSIQTLIIAAVSSGIAAVVVSQVWEQGTVFSAAITPVIVALVGEFLKRPTEQVSRRVTSRRRPPQAGGERERVPLPSEPDYEPPVPGRRSERDLPPEVRVYRGGGKRVRPVHVGVALATGLIAFAIAATVLTVPELIFGKSVDGKRDTTFFGGRERERDTEDQETPAVTVPQETQPAPEEQTTPEEEPPPTTTTPPGTETQPPSAQPPGMQQPPGGGAPAPQQAPPPAQ
jgi:hypothetical protein